MSRNPENPAAFARPASVDNFGDHPTSEEAQTGMTLRDYFATAAMQGIVGSIHTEQDYVRLKSHAKANGQNVSEWIATDAYKQANAMLKARQS